MTDTQTTANDTTLIRSGIIGSVAAAATADEYLHCLRQWLLVLYIFFYYCRRRSEWYR